MVIVVLLVEVIERTTSNLPHISVTTVNFGCPQKIAKRGKYGAFLLEDKDLVRRVVSTLSRELDAPVSVKIRVFPSEKETIEMVKMLEDAGCQLLTGLLWPEVIVVVVVVVVMILTLSPLCMQCMGGPRSRTSS